MSDRSIATPPPSTPPTWHSPGTSLAGRPVVSELPPPLRDSDSRSPVPTRALAPSPMRLPSIWADPSPGPWDRRMISESKFSVDLAGPLVGPPLTRGQNSPKNRRTMSLSPLAKPFVPRNNTATRDRAASTFKPSSSSVWSSGHMSPPSLPPPELVPPRQTSPFSVSTDRSTSPWSPPSPSGVAFKDQPSWSYTPSLTHFGSFPDASPCGGSPPLPSSPGRANDFWRVPRMDSPAPRLQSVPTHYPGVPGCGPRISSNAAHDVYQLATNRALSNASPARTINVTYHTTGPWAGAEGVPAGASIESFSRPDTKKHEGRKGYRARHAGSEIESPVKCEAQSAHLQSFDAKTETTSTLLLDRIIEENDQQASMILQRQIRNSAGEERSLLVSTIKECAHLLMINPFGNFVVQKCLEYGTPGEVESITRGMLGYVVQLSKDPFGCHVIQKAIDCAGPATRHSIVKELLATPLSTVDHRYACHVWQKLIEFRWADDGNEFMNSFNEKLKGEWVKVAVGANGGLLVQNVFENCTPDQKEPCLTEILADFDTVICSQWGNWVVQHLVEHAGKDVRVTVIRKIVASASTYSIHQFASKAVERMLKLGETPVIQDYLLKITESPFRRSLRVPLVDIASDTHGTYLIQFILSHGTEAQKELIATRLKKHMVSLRGSKWGGKCALLIERNRSPAAKQKSPTAKESKE